MPKSPLSHSWAVKPFKKRINRLWLKITARNP